MSNTGYKEAYSEISSQQQKIEQAKKQLREQKLSVPERIRQREAIRASPRYRESAKRQEISRQKALSEISEEGKSLKEQLEAIEKYEKEGYEIKKTPKGYEFLKKIKGEPKYKAVTKKVVDTSSKKYIEITNEISDVNKRINNLQKMQKAAPNESIKKALGNTIDFWKKKKSKLLKDRQKYKKVTTAKKEVDTWETLTGVVEGKSVSGVPTYSPIYDVARKAETRLAEERLDEIEEPSTTTRLVAAGFTPETYESVGEVTIGAPEAGLPYKTFKASEQPYEKIPEYYESIPKIQAEKLREVEEAKQQKMISSLPSSIRTAVTSRTITTPEGKKAIIPTLPDFYKSADGEDILGMGIEYERIMKSVISNNISNEKATDLLTKKLNEKLSKANEDTLIKWLGYNPNTPYPAGESKKIFLNPIIAQDIANYTQTYNLIKSYADKGYYKGSATKQVKEILTGTNKRQDAKKWISNNLTPEEYSDINLSKEGSFVDFQTYKNYHPDRRAVVLNIDTKGKDLSSIFKPTVSYKAADKEEWERLGKTYVLPEWLRPLEVGASIIIGKTLGQEEAITPAQLSKAFVVGGTQWPRTIWSAASAIPPAIESGDYVKEYRAQLEPQLYEAGYRISEAATRGHKTGDWGGYVGEIATTPAMTDVVYPLAIGAGFSAAGSKIGAAGGRIAKGVSKVSSGVTKTISKKLPTVVSKLSKVGVTPANIRKVGFGIGRRVGTPYGMTTIFMAPSAAEMGAQTARYQKGEISREQWIQSLQRGARTGFQLGMFSAGATYKPTGQFTKSVKRFGSKLKHAIEHPRGYYTVSKGGVPSEGYYYSKLERVSPFGKRTTVNKFRDFTPGGRYGKEASLKQFGLKEELRRPVKYVGVEEEKFIAGDVDYWKKYVGSGEAMPKLKVKQRTFIKKPLGSYEPPDVSTKYATVKRWRSERMTPWETVPAEKLPKLSKALAEAKKSPVVSKKNIIKPSYQTKLEKYGLDMMPKEVTDSLQWASEKYLLKGPYVSTKSKVWTGTKEPYYHTDVSGKAIKGKPSVSEPPRTVTIHKEPTVTKNITNKYTSVKQRPPVIKDTGGYPSIGEHPGSGVQYPIRKGGYAEAYGYGSGGGEYADEIIHSFWKSSSPFFSGPKLPKTSPTIRKQPDIDTGRRVDRIHRERLDFRPETGMITSTLPEIGRDIERQPAIDIESARDVTYIPATGTSTAQQQRQDLLSPQVTAQVPEIKTPEYKFKKEKPIKFRLPLPDDDEKKKFYRRGGRTARGLGYKERFYKVKGFELGKNKPKYINIIK